MRNTYVNKAATFNDTRKRRNGVETNFMDSMSVHTFGKVIKKIM